MNDQNKYAIIGMFAVVITLYALRHSHTHYLPDLFGLALATTAPRPSYAIGAVLLLAMIRHSPLARGLAESVPGWLIVVLLPGARDMSIPAEESSALESAYKDRILESESELEYIEIPQPVAENAAESIDLAKSELLARLVLAGEVGKTKAVQIGAGAMSGKKYQKWSRLVEVAMDRQRNHYPAGSTLKRYE
jgi:hypothetical protein